MITAFVRLADASDLFGSQQFRQRQSAKRQGTQSQRIAAGDSVAQRASAMARN